MEKEFFKILWEDIDKKLKVLKELEEKLGKDEKFKVIYFNLKEKESRVCDDIRKDIVENGFK